MGHDAELETSATPPGGSGGSIGPYRVSRVIGTGGMGVVYQAVHPRLEMPVAVKLIRGSAHVRDMRRRFEEEAGQLALLNHPAVVRIIDYGTHVGDSPEPNPYIVMEYVAGGRPITASCRESACGLDQVLDLFIQLFDALAHFHARGIYHRDIKPTNILVDSEGRPKIIDFGLALARGAQGGMISLVVEGGLPVGTPAYMSPEQRVGDPMALDHRTDIYSLALVLFEVLTGGPPDVLDEAPDLSRLAPEIPAALRAVLRGALEPRRSDRTASAGEVRDALKRIRERRLAEAVLPGGREPTRVRLTRWTLGALAAAVGAFVVFPLGVLIPATGELYARWATGVLTDPSGDFQKVRVITLTDETLAALGGGGGPLGILDARSSHPTLMDRLVAGGASVIVWDLMFASDVPRHDPAFAESMQRSAGAGIPVVLMVRMWSPDHPWGRVSSVLAGSPAHVAPGTGSFTDGAPWSVDLLIRRGDGFLEPSLALTAAALSWMPDARPDFELDESARTIAVRHWRPDVSGRRVQAGRTIVVPYSGHRRFDDSGVQIGVSPGDFTAQQVVRVRTDAALARGAVRYEDVLGMDTDELLASFAGRAVVIGRTDEGGEDIKPHPGGRRIAGVFAHAEAIEALLLSQRIGVARDVQMFALCATAGLVGFLSLFRGGRSAWRWAWLVLVAAGAGGLCLAAVWVRTIVYPAPIALSVLVGGVIAAAGWRLLGAGRFAS